jgi:hypothetical protein
MTNRSFGWVNAKSLKDEDALTAGGFKVKSKHQPGARNLLWIHVQLPDGAWAYHVLDGASGEQVCEATDRTKKGAYAKARGSAPAMTCEGSNACSRCVESFKAGLVRFWDDRLNVPRGATNIAPPPRKASWTPC